MASIPARQTLGEGTRSVQRQRQRPMSPCPHGAGIWEGVGTRRAAAALEKECPAGGGGAEAEQLWLLALPAAQSCPPSQMRLAQACRNRAGAMLTRLNWSASITQQHHHKITELESGSRGTPWLPQEMRRQLRGVFLAGKCSCFWELSLFALLMVWARSVSPSPQDLVVCVMDLEGNSCLKNHVAAPTL